MIRFNKKIYYKYFDLHRISTFLQDTQEGARSSLVMRIVKESDAAGLDLSDDNHLHNIGLDTVSIEEIKEYKQTKHITSIERFIRQVPEWIRNLILPDFFDTTWLSELLRNKSITSQKDLYDYFSSPECQANLGEEEACLYAHFTQQSQWKDFPVKYAVHYSEGNHLEAVYNGLKIRGNFHNHSTFSDGIYDIEELLHIAQSSGRDYVGISDHTQSMHGVTEESILEQHSLIDKLNQESSCRLLKSLECEILPDGALDMSEDVLDSLDYTIIAIHTDTYQTKKDIERRLIRAIENPHSNILAHPSARLHKKKVALIADMHKIIDACIDNGVAIEINGDPERIDLDPKYIQYALEKGAMFTLDSDTHTANSFKNINNAVHIARDFGIPADRCLNTLNIQALEKFIRK